MQLFEAIDKQGYLGKYWQVPDAYAKFDKQLMQKV
jgi:hypothetical protein